MGKTAALALLPLHVQRDTFQGHPGHATPTATADIGRLDPLLRRNNAPQPSAIKQCPIKPPAP